MWRRGQLGNKAYHSLRSHADLLLISHTIKDSFPRLLHGFVLAAFSTDLFKMLKVPSVDGCDILATEYTDLKLLCCWITR